MGAHMTADDHNQIWDYVEAGESYSSIAKMMSSRLTTIRDFVAKHDGLRPLPPKPRSDKRLSVAEREEISTEVATVTELSVPRQQLQGGRSDRRRPSLP